MVVFIITATIVEWIFITVHVYPKGWPFGYAKKMVNLNGIDIGCWVAQPMFVRAFF